jgi:parallel beta-helix repeat protein
MSIIPSTAQDIEKPSLTTSSGKWLYVGGSGPGNYSVIQDAVDNTSDGDTVFVYHGFYHHHYPNNRGCIDIIKKNINLVGEDKYSTIIDGKDELGIIHVDAPVVNISGFTLQYSNWFGIEIGFNWVESVTIHDNIITGHEDDDIIVWMGTNNIFNNTISNSSCGIYFNADNNKIYNNHIVNNSYGIHFAQSRSANIHNNLIGGNEFGIFSEYCRATINNNNFIQNTYQAIFNQGLSFIAGIHWTQNYWGRPRLLPYPIYGTFLIFPWIQFDWQPAQEPYDIPGIS